MEGNFNLTGGTTKTGTGLMNNDALWKSATNRGFPQRLKSLAKPRSALPHFSQARQILHPITGDGEGERPASRKICFVTSSMAFGSCSAPHPSLNLTGLEPLL